MNGKKAKMLRKVAKAIARSIGDGTTFQTRKFYKRLKKEHTRGNSLEFV